MSFDEGSAVADFDAARRRGEHFPLAWHDRLGFDEAYRIQLGVAARRVADGERQAGWKVAQTSEAARRSFGFAEPLFGCLMQDDLRASGHTYGGGDLISPGCEPEFCLRLGKTLTGAVDIAAARAAVDEVHPAFEIIERRGDIMAQKALAIADNAAGKGAVLGTPVPLGGLGLTALGCRVRVNGADAARGRGEDVLGDPLNALVWLAATLARFGRALQPGDLVLTGSITRMLPLQPGDNVCAEFDGIGRIEVSLARA